MRRLIMSRLIWIYSVCKFSYCSAWRFTGLGHIFHTKCESGHNRLNCCCLLSTSSCLFKQILFIDPGVRHYGIVNSPRYLWFKYECFLISSYQGINFWNILHIKWYAVWQEWSWECNGNSTKITTSICIPYHHENIFVWNWPPQTCTYIVKMRFKGVK